MIRRLLTDSRSELIALASTIVGITITLWKALQSFPISASCIPWSDRCLASIWSLPTGTKIVFPFVLLLAVFLVYLNILKWRDSWRNAKIEPVGFFFDRVTEPDNPSKVIEHSLVEIHRTRSGGLEYRGVGRRPDSKLALDYFWRARDAWVHKANGGGRHTLIFQTSPDDIKFYAQRFREDGTPLPTTGIFNVGVIKYSIDNGRPEPLTGIFFDYLLGDGYLRRGRIELNPTTGIISAAAPRVFDEFFAAPALDKGQRKVEELIKNLEQYF